MSCEVASGATPRTSYSAVSFAILDKVPSCGLRLLFFYFFFERMGIFFSLLAYAFQCIFDSMVELTVCMCEELEFECAFIVCQNVVQFEREAVFGD